MRVLLKSKRVAPQNLFLIIPLSYHISSVIPRVDVCLQIVDGIMRDRDRYMYPVMSEHCTRVAVFREMVRNTFPHTYSVLMKLEALSDKLLNKIFVGHFFDILSHDHAMRILDMYLVCGEEILFQYGLALIHMFKKQIKSRTFKSGKVFWDTLKRSHDVIDFEILSALALEDDRPPLTKFMTPKLTSTQFHTFKEKYTNIMSGRVQAMNGYVLQQLYALASLEAAASTWFDDSMWRQSTLLSTMQAVNLQIFLSEVNITPNAFKKVFSTAKDGFSLKTLYAKAIASGAQGPCILMLKSKRRKVVIGVYMSCPISAPTREPMGDPTCFVFKLDRKPKRFFSSLVSDCKIGSGSVSPKDFGVDEDSFKIISGFLHGLSRAGTVRWALQSQSSYQKFQFLKFTQSSIYVGTNIKHKVNQAIHIIDNLQSATCGACETYRNPPLAPEERISPFKIEILELYCAASVINTVNTDESLSVEEAPGIDWGVVLKRFYPESKLTCDSWSGGDSDGGITDSAEEDTQPRSSLLSWLFSSSVQLPAWELPTAASRRRPSIESDSGPEYPPMEPLEPSMICPLIRPTPLQPLAEPLPMDYAKHRAKEKQTLLWDRLSESPYPPDWMPNEPNSGWGLVNPLFLSRIFSLAADEIPEGRVKGFNTYGAVAKVTFRCNTPHPFTGLFKSGAPGIMRFSLSQPILKDEDSFRPGLALKLLIDGDKADEGQPSLNLFAAGHPDGQWRLDDNGKKRGNYNFFAQTLSSSPGGKSHASSIPFFILPKRLRPSTWESLPMHKASYVNTMGDLVDPDEAEYPVKIDFVPEPGLEDFHEYGGPEDNGGFIDFRTQLARVPAPGTVLYKVIGYHDEFTIPREIGEIVLESPIIASKYGDEHLFFQHPLPLGR